MTTHMEIEPIELMLPIKLFLNNFPSCFSENICWGYITAHASSDPHAFCVDPIVLAQAPWSTFFTWQIQCSVSVMPSNPPPLEGADLLSGSRTDIWTKVFQILVPVCYQIIMLWILCPALLMSFTTNPDNNKYLIKEHLQIKRFHTFHVFLSCKQFIYYFLLQPIFSNL